MKTLSFLVLWATLVTAANEATWAAPKPIVGDRLRIRDRVGTVNAGNLKIVPLSDAEKLRFLKTQIKDLKGVTIQNSLNLSVRSPVMDAMNNLVFRQCDTVIPSDNRATLHGPTDSKTGTSSVDLNWMSSSAGYYLVDFSINISPGTRTSVTLASVEGNHLDGSQTQTVTTDSGGHALFVITALAQKNSLLRFSTAGQDVIFNAVEISKVK